MKKLLSLLLAISLLLTFAACDDEEEAPDRGTDPFNYFIDYQSDIYGNKFSSPLKNNSERYNYINIKTFDNTSNSNSTYRNIANIVLTQPDKDDITIKYNDNGLLSEYKEGRQTTKFTFNDDKAFEITGGGTGSYNDNFMLTSLNYTVTEYNSDVTNNYNYDDQNRLTKQTWKETFATGSEERVYAFTYQDEYLKEYKLTSDGVNQETRVYEFSREEKRPVKCTITESRATSTIEYEYNDEGYVAKATLTGTDLDQTEEYTWSENGFLDKVVYKDKKAGTTITYDYEYSKGVLLSIKKDGSDYKTYEITER